METITTPRVVVLADSVNLGRDVCQILGSTVTISQQPTIARSGSVSNRIIATGFLAVLCCVGCGKKDSNLRGSFEASHDGQTYLIIDHKQGGCGTLNIDGKAWSHPIGEAGLIAPGHHRISCGGDIEF